MQRRLLNNKYFTVRLEARKKVLIVILPPESNLIPVMIIPHEMAVEKEYCKDGKYLYELRAEEDIEGKIIVGFKVKKGEEK